MASILFNYVENCKSRGEISDVQCVFRSSVRTLFETCFAVINIKRIRLKITQKKSV
jgi:hypothetical protein